MIILNTIVWRDAADLEHLVWNTVHKRFYSQREKWFSVMKMEHFVMWWVDEGHRPALNEANARLDRHNELGNSDHAFGWSHLPQVKLWQQARCA